MSRRKLPDKLTPEASARMDEMLDGFTPVAAAACGFAVVEAGYAMRFQPAPDMTAAELAALLPMLLTAASGRPVVQMTPFLEGTGLSRHFTREAV
jgi:hypothetical protein